MIRKLYKILKRCFTRKDKPVKILTYIDLTKGKLKR
jgi:hypothetical protein